MSVPVSIPLPQREALTDDERIERARIFADDLTHRLQG